MYRCGLCIDFEAIHEVFDRLEHVRKCIIASYYATDRLGNLDVRRISTREVETHTSSKIPRMAVNVFAGANNVCKNGLRYGTDHQHRLAYEANIVGADV